MSSLNYSEFCRLCLVKERVSTPIFEGEGDVRRIFLKIATCLPIKVSREDHLPKSICDDCLYKVENQYQFWNTTANSEKQLHQWLGSTPGDSIDVKNVHASGMDPMEMKQESMDMDQGSELSKSLSRVEAVIAEEAGRVAAAAHGEDEDEEEEESEEEGSNSEESEDDDNDADERNKEDDDEDEAYDEELEPTTFVNVSLACDEAGPSGTQQTSVAPSTSTSAPAASGTWKVGCVPIRDLQFLEKDPIAVGDTKAVETVPPRRTRSTGPLSEMLSFTCHCFRTFYNTEDLELHMQQPHYVRLKKKKILYPCTNCEVTYTKQSYLDKHINKMHSEKVCKKCKIVVGQGISMKEHRECHKKEWSFKCVICNRGFKREADLNKHAERHIPEIFYCDVCEFSTHLKNKLRYHILASHNIPRDFVCNICGKGFLIRAVYFNHMETHGERKHMCNICGKTYTRLSYLANHEKRHESSKTKLCLCEICGKSYENRSRLKGHVSSSHNNVRCKCEVCGKLFTSAESLKHHRRIHTGERPYFCTICGKTFSANRYLRSHQRVHTGEKPHKCILCGKDFAQRSSLTLHMKYHSGLKPYECELCPKAFITKSLLVAHEKSHKNALLKNRTSPSI